jgi:hypothetical protein
MRDRARLNRAHIAGTQAVHADVTIPLLTWFNHLAMKHDGTSHCRRSQASVQLPWPLGI